MREIKTQIKEEFVRTQNRMKIETITLPSKNVNNQSEKHLLLVV